MSDWVLDSNDSQASDWVIDQPSPAFKQPAAQQPAIRQPSAADMLTGALTHPASRNDQLAFMASIAVPEVKMGGWLLPKAGPLVKGAANYLGGIGQQAGLFGAVDKLQGGSATEGALVGGGSSAAIQPLAHVAGASSNPLVRAGARTLLGGGLGYMVGGTPGAGVGASLGLGGPQLLKEVGMAPGVANPAQSIAQEVSQHADRAELAKVIQAANELGTDLSMGEATGNPYVTEQEGKFGKRGEPAYEAVKIGERKRQQQKAAIEGLKRDISPEGGDAAQAVREAAQGHIEELKSLRKAESEPMYDAAKEQEISQPELDDLLEHPRIKQTYADIIADPDYSYALGGKPPTNKKMVAMVENRIDNLIEKARRKSGNVDRIKELEYAKENFATDYGDPRVQNVLGEIYRDDPVFHATASGINPRSIELLDLIKKKINTAAENIGSKLNPGSMDKYKAGLIGSAADKLTAATDKASYEYRLARERFGDMSDLIVAKEKGTLGRVANLKDTQLKNLSKTLFDPSQTNLRELAIVKKDIMRRNPRAWDMIVRNEIERLTKKGVNDGVDFYKSVLENDNQFKQFELALDHNPKALQTLRNMKTAWKNLTRPVTTTKTAAGQEKVGMKGFRDSMMSLLSSMTTELSAAQQKKALQYINSKAWQADAMSIATVPAKKAKDKFAAKMLMKIVPMSYLTATSDDNE